MIKQIRKAHNDRMWLTVFEMNNLYHVAREYATSDLVTISRHQSREDAEQWFYTLVREYDMKEDKINEL